MTSFETTGVQVSDSRRRGDLLAIGAALLTSVVLIWLVSGSAILGVAYAGGLAVLGLIGFIAITRRAGPKLVEGAGADWSVTLAAIERSELAPDLAVAITDRANRLVCANAAFRDWFGVTHGPPRLDAEEPSGELLARIARNAWREGSGGEALTIIMAGQAFAVEARRAGHGDDHLVWRFAPVREQALAEAVARRLAGRIGQVLGEGGIGAALVDADGIVRAANAAFIHSAGGEEEGAPEGKLLADLLQIEESGAIRFAHEAPKGPMRLVAEAALSESGAAQDGGEPAADAPRLVLLIDEAMVRGGRASEQGEGDSGLAQIEALAERLPMGLAATDRDGRFLYANTAFRRAAGIGERDLPPYPSDLVARQDKTAIADAVRRYVLGAAASGDISVRLAAQPDETVSIGIAGIRGVGEATVLLSLADSSEENRLKRQVAQATKMQAVGQLAGGVAHDFNNVLTAIIGTCDLMLLRHAPGDSDYDDIRQIRANSDRAASLTRQLLAFSRQQTLKPEIIQIPDVLGEVMQLLKRVIGARITMKVHHDRNLGTVRADPRQLEQVIVNLAVNARHAIEEKGGGEQASGTISFTTRSISPEDVRRMGSEIMPPGAYTALIVEDSGGGIPQRVLAKVFEPFFTTKEPGRGTGLGLSTVYGIIKQSGGFIFADNVRGGDGSVRGARFTIYLPVYIAGPGEVLARRRAEDEPATALASGPAHEAVGEGEAEAAPRGGRILLVEDEDMVRAIAERALVREGYEVVTARDGEEGLQAIAAPEAVFDLVVSDVVMPGVDGPSMVREIRRERPAMPVLFMSGYAEAQLREQIDMDAVHFIAKPFSLRQIADKVAEVMRAERAP